MNRSFKQLNKLVLSIVALVVALGVTSGFAFADGNDFQLSHLCQSNAGGTCGGNADDNFRDFARNIAMVMAPGHFAPANTLGQAGFETTVAGQMHFAQASESWYVLERNYEDKAFEEGKKYDPADFMTTIQLQMRKGLPFSMEIGGEANWLVESGLFYVGGHFGLALNEGFTYAPDVAVRAKAGTVVGSRDLTLIMVGLDAVVSYDFGIVGLMSLIPYGGYSAMVSIASSRPLSVRLDGTDKEVVFSRSTQFEHHGFAGLDLKADYFICGVNGTFSKDIMSVGVKIGANF